jgi:hypothetical protein
MKNIKSLTWYNLKNSLLVVIFGLQLSTFNSCVKGEESSVDISSLSIIHASPGLPAIDFYFNGGRINGDSIIAYGDTIPNKFLNSGTASIVVKKYISSITYISTSIEFASEKNYSFFIAGKPNEVTYLLTTDDLNAPASGKAKLRFINLSPDAPDLSFKMNSGNLFSSMAFKAYSEFSLVDPGNHVISIHNSASGAKLAEQNLTIEAGKVYTIWAKGLVTTTESDLVLSMQVVGLQP